MREFVGCAFCWGKPEVGHGVKPIHIAFVLTHWKGVRGGAVDWGTALQVGRSRVWFVMVSLEFFIDVILPATLWPWGWLSL